MDYTSNKKRVKTIIIPEGAFDTTDTIILKVPKSRPQSQRSRSISPSKYNNTPSKTKSYFFNDPVLPHYINKRLEKAYYEGFQEGQRLVNNSLDLDVSNLMRKKENVEKINQEYKEFLKKFDTNFKSESEDVSDPYKRYNYEDVDDDDEYNRFYSGDFEK